ncbi:LOW QUALITY PROTEIN: interferon-induced very large GTPase 1 [Xenopus laevis]|uniref:LOW QUALITY PROTEIN: interferon-induced very large GTPase 1 n=1 Tax=Xenopus laevis TaxID=8355 RepID=A0A8J1LTS8_XENLA|nr:LOW QUALITY PROTEIN: interferon-induced very large GTPase 1 [Xenopus laevis]
MAPTPDTIKRLIERLTEIFSNDPLCSALRPNSFLTIDPEKDVHLSYAESPKERAERLLNYVLQRGDADYRKFLEQLATLRPRFPALSHVLESERKRTTLIDIITQHKDAKLSLRNIMDIGKENMNECCPTSVQDLPLTLLRKLAALERTARDTLLLECDQIPKEEENMDDLFNCDAEEHIYKSINPLDVLCVLLNCSDSFLQQQIFSKMSMCQFAVPLLLPAGDAPECTFMLWAMRDIVKRWRPQTLPGSKASIEESLVNISMPHFLVLRLGQSKLSKSKILNQMLSPAQQYNDFFIHDNMTGGNIERHISNGLVEISWCFPVGNKTSLTFPEPIAITNIRGNLECNKSQLDFLMQVSAAVFVFAENINERECEILSQYSKSATPLYFIITPSDRGISREAAESFRKFLHVLNIGPKNILRKDKIANDAELANKMRDIMRNVLGNSCKRITLEDMSHKATQFGFLVDEMSNECQKAKAYATEITKEIKDVVQYKKETLKLQGDLWKEVSQTEKELCRMRKKGDLTIEQYNSILRERLSALRTQQNQQPLPTGMGLFISAITQLSHVEKHYFLKWMKFTLDSLTQKIILKLRADYKEKTKSEINKNELIQLGQKISDSSLGVEHFLREMGQFYESECFMVKTKQIIPTSRQFTVLPKIAADLLLDGFPLELIDGDASNIPLQWVTDVLAELDNKTGGKCRMRVISVLGVQSTGKSTLLNTMFGLQFPVASGRCTKGVFMTLIKVETNLEKNLGCEFVLVIDTEGLKAEELASLEDNYEHDNELATLVVGLSDITIINIAGENLVDMKDILQIVAHAFLRMKTIRDKPKWQFVHQNVSDVCAHDNNMMDKTKLLEQLNQMTRAAANMEKMSGITCFSDIMDYNLEKDNWYIPGLWYGDPPMASVNPGYSGNIYKLKQYLFQFMEKEKSIRKPYNIGEFIKYIESFWNSVKHENFIFSFRNSLEAAAYDQLSMKYSQWEWDFRKQVHTWLISTENKNKNQSADELTPSLGYKHDLSALLYKEENMMLANVEKYFESKSNNVHLIERYRADFSQDVKCFQKEMEHSATAKVDDVFRIQTQNHQLQNIQRDHQRTIEENVTSLLERLEKNETHRGDKEVKDTFENMWENTLSELPRNPLEKRKISQEMLQEIRMDMANRGGSIHEKIHGVKDLGDFGKGEFMVNESHIDIRCYSLIKLTKVTKEFNDQIQTHACVLIRSCSEYVTEKVNTKGDFDRTYCKELLHRISENLNENEYRNLHFTREFELDIKLHILGNAAPRFQVMHNTFLTENDPVFRLQNLKPQYWLRFENILKESETQSRARQFCELCLKPAIMKHIFQHIGKDIVDDILKSENGREYCSRTAFQFTVLKKLLERQDFTQFVQYINSYKWFVKRWIIDHILDRYSDGQKLEKMQVNILSHICNDVKEILNNSELLNKTTVSDFLKQFCLMLQSKLVIPEEAIEVIVFQSKADIWQFSWDIKEFLIVTEKAMESEFNSYTIEDILFNASVKPDDELIKRVIGCGKQCPFCKVSCEAGGDHHEEHFASIHRPQGLGRCTPKYYKKLFGKIMEFLKFFFTLSLFSNHEELQTLSADICSTHVISDAKFSCADTAWQWHPYKEYRKVYPDWKIQPDPTITASDFWKYIFAKFNNKFAEEYETTPADLPNTWHQITEEQALQSLMEACD